MNNAIFETIFKLVEFHNDKFGYHANIATADINMIIDKALFGYIDDDVLELEKLLENSIRDNIDYLPERYNYNVKEVMGDVNDILIDYYDH